MKYWAGLYPGESRTAIDAGDDEDCNQCRREPRRAACVHPGGLLMELSMQEIKLLKVLQSRKSEASWGLQIKMLCLPRYNAFLELSFVVLVVQTVVVIIGS
jgi:hypothetical protein